MRSQSGPVESDGLRIIGDAASPPRTVGPGWSTWRADAMMGRIRLVNPDRGTALAASSGRLVAASTDRGGHWELHLTPWRFTDAPWQTPATWEFQNRVNDRINWSDDPGRFRFAARIYERTADGQAAIRHGLNGRRRPVGMGELPDGHLAEPWESERLALCR